MKRLAMVALALAIATPALAGDLPAPSGKVLLTISGAIENTNAPGAARFDRDMLHAVDWTRVETHTYWTEGPQVFEGPSLAALLAAVGAKGAVLKASAINDYTIEIPAADAAAHHVVMAMDLNGEPMKVRDKGPIWVVYPLSPEEVPLAKFNDRMIWQLDRLAVE